MYNVSKDECPNGMNPDTTKVLERILKDMGKSEAEIKDATDADTLDMYLYMSRVSASVASLISASDFPMSLRIRSSTLVVSGFIPFGHSSLLTLYIVWAY